MVYDIEYTMLVFCI